MEFVSEIILFFVYSVVIVLISKYLLIRILRKLGELLKLKPKTMGNIAGIATSIPELLTVSFSAFTGLIATSTYNILSSNIINFIQYEISLVLNKNQKKQNNKVIKIDLILVLITIIIPIIMIVFKIENNIRIIPFFIISLIMFYRISHNAHKLYGRKNKSEMRDKEKKIEKEAKENIKKTENISIENYTKKDISRVVIQACLLVLVGVILYFIGNELSNILDLLCRKFKVSEFIIGILLGIITSIPEFITFLESQKYHSKEEEGMIEATGNLLTSNMMNLFIIQSIGIIIYTIFQ